MVDLLYELGGSLEIKNRQGLTPLTLAAVKARKEVDILSSAWLMSFGWISLRCLIISYRRLVRSTGSMERWHVQDIRWMISIPLAKMVRSTIPVHWVSLSEEYVWRWRQVLNQKLHPSLGIRRSSGYDGWPYCTVVEWEMACLYQIQVRWSISLGYLPPEWRTFCLPLIRFFQRMAIFSVYFTICLMALLLRGYYRVPSSCVIQEVLDKEENTFKSIIIDRIDCKCHYTNFFWHKPFPDYENSSVFNRSVDTSRTIDTEDDRDKNEYYLTGLVGDRWWLS